MEDEDAKRLLQRAISRGLVSAGDVHETMRRHEAERGRPGARPPLEILAEVAGLDRRTIAALDDRSMVGRVLGGFRIDAKLGEGAMGAVFRATQVSLGRTCALKILDPSLACKEEFVERFRREVRAAARLDHPNVVQPIETGEEGGMLFFAMELMEGGSAAARLQKSGPFPERDAIEVGIAISRALEYAGEHGIVHRDVKPDNILFSKHGVVKLADLGLVLDSRSETSLTEPGMTMGTPDYMSPEQAQGMRDLDARSDVYAVGVTLFQLATGRLPFEGPDPLSVALQHVNQPPPDPRDLAPALSGGFAALVLKTLAKRRDDRHAGGRELRLALEALRAAGEAVVRRGDEPSLTASVSGGEAPLPLAATPLALPSASTGALPAPSGPASSGPAPVAPRASASGRAGAPPVAAATPTPTPAPATGGQLPSGPHADLASPSAPRPRGRAPLLVAAAALLALGLFGASRAGLLGGGAGRSDPAELTDASRKLRSNLLGRRHASGAYGANRDWPADSWTTGQVLAALGTLPRALAVSRDAKTLHWLLGQELKAPEGAGKGWPCLDDPPDRVSCTETTAWVAIGLALREVDAAGDAEPSAEEEAARAAERARLRALLTGPMTKDGGIPSVPEAGAPAVRTSGTAMGLLALTALDAAEEAAHFRRGGRVERDPERTARETEPIERAARWLGLTYDRTRRSWTPHPDADGPTAPTIAGLGDFCAYVLLEADARLARARRAMPWEARQALEDYAASPPAPAALPWSLVGTSAPEQYRFPPIAGGAHSSLAAVRWVAASSRLLVATRLAVRPDLPRAAGWAQTARRQRASAAAAPAELESAYSFQVSETLIALNLAGAFREEDPRAGSLYHWIVERGGAATGDAGAGAGN